MENLNSAPENSNPEAEKWQNIAEESTEEDFLPLFSEVGYGGYKISSLPFDSKDEAYEEIRNNWQGADVTTHFHNGKWYVISK